MTAPDNERTRLINVLRRTARMASQAQWTEDHDEALAAHCAGQYNRVLARLTVLDPDVAAVFEPLPDDAALSVAGAACRQLAAYYADDTEADPGWGWVYGAAIDTDAFKKFWHRASSDIEDLGEYIRESVDTWARQQRKDRPKDDSDGAEPTSDQDAQNGSSSC